MKTNMILISLACVVIILAGLKAASAIIVPFLIAIFIAVVISPLVLYVQRLRVGKFFSFLIVICMFLATFGFFLDVVFDAVRELSAGLPELQNKFENLINLAIDKINTLGFVQLDKSMLGFDVGVVFSQTTAILRKTGSLVSMGFFVFIMVAFMVLESSVIETKMQYFASKSSAAHDFTENFTHNLKKYLLIKTIASAATGFLIGLFLYSVGIPYAPLWGMVAFVLNFIPTIGSIIAVFPTLFITLATMEPITSLWVVFIYLFVNVLIGNIIEPRFLGEGLGISTVAVLASLLLWGFVFGIGGLFLAIPLTMSIQIALNSSKRTKFLSILLSNKIEKI